MDWLFNVLSPLKKLQIFATVVFLAFITACGSGGFDEPVDPGTGNGGTTNVTTITLSISDTNVAATTPATITATVSDSVSGNLSGVVVTFSTTLGVLNPPSGTALTDANGQATIEIQAGTVQGAGEVTATARSALSSTIGFTSAGDGTSVPGKVVVISSSNSNITAANPATVTARVTNGGVAVAGDVVSFTSTLGVFSPASGTALTNASGDAVIVLAAGTVEGAGLITATTTSGEFNTIGFSTAGDGSEMGGNSLTITSFTNSTSISNANPASITVHFEEADGTDLANQVISFTTTLGVLNPTTGTALTNATGDATISLGAGTVRGAGTVTATSSAGDVVTGNFFTQGDGAETGGNSLTITSFTNSTSISNANPAVIIVHFEEADGTDLANQVINFTTTLGVLNPVTGTALTSGTGDATITLGAGTVRGAGTLTATSSAGDVVTRGFFTQGDGSVTGGNSLTITSFTNSTSISNANPAVITVHFEEADGTDLANQVISFTTTLGVLSPTTGTALTNATGDATITLAAGTVQGAGILTATSSAGDVVTQGFFTQGDGSAAGGNSLTIASFTNQTLITSAASGSVIVHYEQADGTDLANEVITFTTTLGVLSPATGTVLTDASGNATITLAAGTVQGAGVLTATSRIGDVVTSGFFTQGDGPAPGNTIVLTSSLPVGTNISDAAPATITAVVSNSSGPIAGEVVTFTTTLGVLNPGSGTALTNPSGVATIQLRAGSVEGAGLLTATLSSGETNSIGFDTDGDTPSGTIRAVTIVFDSNNNISAADPGELTVSVTEGGFALTNELVTFTTTLGALDPVSGTALTDGIGQATMILGAGSVEGAGLVTARITSGESASVGFTTTGDLSSDIISLELTDSGGTPLSPRQINSTTPGKIVATVTGINQPVLVTFSSDLGDIPINTAITDSVTNQAIVDIFAAGSLGAGTITATLTTGETAQMVFSIGASSLGIGTTAPDNVLVPTQVNLSAGGTTNIPVTIWDTSGAPVPFTDGVQVTFSSTCSRSGLALIDSPVTTVNGTATATYQAQGCEISDTITATANAGGVVLSANGSITVAAATVGSLQFISATPEKIVLQGTGGAGSSETSIVKFKLVDVTGNPMENEEVCFNLNTNNGGVAVAPMPIAGTACAIAGAEASGQTDSNGEVNAIVSSGTAATTVRVTADATIGGTTVTTQSSNLVVSIGVPDQDSFSLSAETFNPEGWNIDGTEVTITARLADAFNNPAPNGTVVNFITEGGAIEDSCTTTNGVCSVIWTSQNARPQGGELDGRDPRTTNIDATTGLANFMGQSYGGRVTIIATAIGNETFPDLNGNGVLDGGDEEDTFLGVIGTGNDVNGTPFDLDEAFLDYNEDGVFNPQVGGGEAGGLLEEFVNFNAPDGDIFDLADTEYNGLLCGATSTICSSQKSINVRGSLVLVMSGSNPSIALATVNDDEGNIRITQSNDGLTDSYVLDGVLQVGPSASDIAGYRRMDLGLEGSGSGTIIIADLHNQPMPAGTIVKFETTVGSLKGTTSFTWPNTSRNGGSAFSFFLKAPSTAESGAINVSITTPSGLETVFTVMSVTVL